MQHIHLPNNDTFLHGKPHIKHRLEAYLYKLRNVTFPELFMNSRYEFSRISTET